ncbi:uncharacterized protein LOC130010363 isoform X2 [Patella vulgata]|uniref:uncharacterized protein LOC130010363 isoform X2 n=1 Tax=Patella vulgata TaxID=6465 RepID=UPI0024A9E91A|nr:uncharacterized protein LOC130010363 isoform X2 [Patella vulgata]
MARRLYVIIFVSIFKLSQCQIVPVTDLSINFTSNTRKLINNTLQIENGSVLLIGCQANNDASPAPDISLHYSKNDVDILNRTTGHYLETSLTVTMEMDGSTLYCKANNNERVERRSTYIKMQVSVGSCQGRCGSKLDRSKSCQCNTRCKRFKDCCDDYDSLCSDPTTMTTMSLHVNNVTDNKIILQCKVDGRPNNYIFSPWKHYLDGVLIREVEGYLENGDNSIYYLNISTQLYKNRGVYVCTGSYSRNGQIYSYTAFTTISVTAPSKFYKNDLETMNETVRAGSDYNISKIFITGSNSNITWFKDNTRLELSSRIGIRRLEVNIPHDYNQTVLIPYSRTLITITPVQVSDEGWYQCFICNHDDCSNSSFHLLVEDKDQVKDSPNNGKQDNISVFIGAGVAAHLIIIIVIIVIVLVVKKRRRKPKDGSSKQEMEIMENHLYISADYDASQNQADGNGVKTTRNQKWK